MEKDVQKTHPFWYIVTCKFKKQSNKWYMLKNKYRYCLSNYLSERQIDSGQYLSCGFWYLMFPKAVGGSRH